MENSIMQTELYTIDVTTRTSWQEDYDANEQVQNEEQQNQTQKHFQVYFDQYQVESDMKINQGGQAETFFALDINDSLKRVVIKKFNQKKDYWREKFANLQMQQNLEKREKKKMVKMLKYIDDHSTLIFKRADIDLDQYFSLRKNQGQFFSEGEYFYVIRQILQTFSKFFQNGFFFSDLKGHNLVLKRFVMDKKDIQDQQNNLENQDQSMNSSFQFDKNQDSDNSEFQNEQSLGFPCYKIKFIDLGAISFYKENNQIQSVSKYPYARTELFFPREIYQIQQMNNFQITDLNLCINGEIYQIGRMLVFSFCNNYSEFLLNPNINDLEKLNSPEYKEIKELIEIFLSLKVKGDDFNQALEILNQKENEYLNRTGEKQVQFIVDKNFLIEKYLQMKRNKFEYFNLKDWELDFFESDFHRNKIFKQLEMVNREKFRRLKEKGFNENKDLSLDCMIKRLEILENIREFSEMNELVMQFQTFLQETQQNTIENQILGLKYLAISYNQLKQNEKCLNCLEQMEVLNKDIFKITNQNEDQINFNFEMINLKILCLISLKEYFLAEKLLNTFDNVENFLFQKNLQLNWVLYYKKKMDLDKALEKIFFMENIYKQNDQNEDQTFLEFLLHKAQILSERKITLDQSIITFKQILILFNKMVLQPKIQYVKILNDLALTYKKLEQFENALEILLNQVLPEYKIIYGINHKQTLGILQTIGNIYKNMKKFDDAFQFYIEVENIFVELNIDPKIDEDYLDLKQNKAILFKNQKQFEMSLKIFEEIIPILESKYGQQNLKVLRSKVNYLKTLKSSGKYYDCLEKYQQLYEIIDKENEIKFVLLQDLIDLMEILNLPLVEIDNQLENQEKSTILDKIIDFFNKLELKDENHLNFIQKILLKIEQFSRFYGPLQKLLDNIQLLKKQSSLKQSSSKYKSYKKEQTPNDEITKKVKL